jgi:hypothetical protein
MNKTIFLTWEFFYGETREGDLQWRHDTQHNNTQHNDIQHEGTISDIQHNDTQHNGIICDTQHDVTQQDSTLPLR